MAEDKKRGDTVTNLREGNISLVLDSYDDIFSDFDPRPYSSKSLSHDFLNECKRATMDKGNVFELRFLVPKNKRNYYDEVKIKKRLKEHFHKHYKEKEKEINKIRWTGIAWFILGAIVMILGTFMYKYRDSGFFFTMLFIISEPASWYFFWEGLNKVFRESHSEVPDFKFYKKMSNSDIYFLDY